MSMPKLYAILSLLILLKWSNKLQTILPSSFSFNKCALLYYCNTITLQMTFNATISKTIFYRQPTNYCLSSFKVCPCSSAQEIFLLLIFNSNTEAYNEKQCQWYAFMLLFCYIDTYIVYQPFNHFRWMYSIFNDNSEAEDMGNRAGTRFCWNLITNSNIIIWVGWDSSASGASDWKAWHNTDMGSIAWCCKGFFVHKSQS